MAFLQQREGEGYCYTGSYNTCFFPTETPGRIKHARWSFCHYIYIEGDVLSVMTVEKKHPFPRFQLCTAFLLSLAKTWIWFANDIYCKTYPERLVISISLVSLLLGNATVCNSVFLLVGFNIIEVASETLSIGLHRFYCRTTAAAVPFYSTFLLNGWRKVMLSQACVIL